MVDTSTPCFVLNRVYSNGVIEEPEIYRVSETDGEWHIDRRNFLKVIGTSLSVFGSGLLSSCFSSGGGTSSSSSSPSLPPNTDNTKYYSLNSIAHNSAIISHATNPDNSILASTDKDGNLKFWDYPSGKLVQSEIIANTTNSSGSVVFSPVGSFIASFSVNQHVRLWNAITGEAVRDINIERNEIGEIVFSPDGTMLAVAVYLADREIYGIALYEVSSGNFLGTLPSQGTGDSYASPVSAMAFTRDGSMLATTSGGDIPGHIILWEIASTGGSLLYDLTGHYATDLAFLNDDTLLATGGAWDDVVKIWDPYTGELQQTLSDLGSIEAVPNSDWVISRSPRHGINIWDAKTTEIVLQIDEYTYVKNITASPDGIYFLSSSEGTVRQWDLATGTPLSDIKVEDSATVDAIAYNTDGSLFVTKSSDTTIRTWDVATATQVLVFESLHFGAAGIVGFNADGNLVTIAGDEKTIKYWQVPAGNSVRTQTTSPMGGFFVVSNNYSMAALTTHHGEEIAIWDLNNDQELIRLPGNGYSINSLIFSPDDSLLASSSNGDLITLWDVATGIQQQMIEDSDNRSLAFSPDGTLLASADERVHIWDIKTGDRLLDIASALSEVTLDVDFTRINNLAFSSDGTFLIFSTGSHHIELVEIPTGEGRLVVSKTACLQSVKIDRNSQHISSDSRDGLIEVWEFPSGDYLTSFLDPNALYNMSLKYFSLVNESGEKILYTLPCDSASELPSDAICVCNCVDGVSTKELPRCSSGGGGGGGGGGGIPICTCDLVCTCNVVYI